jgi:hypothetical protein
MATVMMEFVVDVEKIVLKMGIVIITATVISAHMILIAEHTVETV